MQKHPGSLAPVVRPIRPSPQSQAPRVRRRVQGERAAGEKALGACTREALAPSLGLPGDFAPSRGHKCRPRPFPFLFPLAQICSSTGGSQVRVPALSTVVVVSDLRRPDLPPPCLCFRSEERRV